MKIFLSLPMSGRTDEEIRNLIDEMEHIIIESGVFKGQEIEFVHNLDNDIDPSGCLDLKHEPLLYLGEAIRKLAFCDAMALGKGWNNARGCYIESDVARHYGLLVFRCYDVEYLKYQSVRQHWFAE
jgi:hypothetical protein